MKDAVNDATSKRMVPDLRFTVKNKVIYLFARSWHDTKVAVRSLPCDQIKSVSLLGFKQELSWGSLDNVLRIYIPEKFETEIPIYVFKIQLKDE